MRSKRGENADISKSKRAARSCRGFLRSVKDRIGARLRSFQRYVADRIGALPLFGAIFLWVVLALVVFTALGWLWGQGALWSDRWLTNWRSAGVGAGPLEVVKVSLTTIGGIGGTGYLVIKYRERASAERAEKAAELARRDIEQEKAEQKLLNAVQQLGSESPQVRIAGVYALADVADTYRGDYRQRVVNILCGYLRTPRGTWQTNAKDDDPASDKTYVSNDGAVESTVLEVLVRHLRKGREATMHRDAVTQLVEDDQLWCDCTIDLHDAVLTEIAEFEGVTFTSDAIFQGTTFANDAKFRGATFTADTNFARATFRAHTTFWYATFTNDANFEDATFTNNANFQGAIFKANANFWYATFTNNANFRGTTFTNDANFRGATFKANATFRDATLTNATFWGATFKNHATFRGATFTNDATFWGATFNNADFQGTTFTSNADFQDASFTNDANFQRATFTNHADFQRATFTSNADFEDATFNRSAPPTGIPRKLVDDETGLPKGARWARCNDKDEVIEAGSPEPDKPSDAAGSS